MPKQSRGFWVCSICSQAFDQFEEANYHEFKLCPHRYSVSSVGDQPFRQQQQIQPESYVMPPLAHVASIPTSSRHRREPSSASFSFEFKADPRIIPLLEENETCILSETDAIICRSLEFFETNEFGESGRLLTQVGMRCSYCTSSSSETFPQSINHVGDCVRQIARQHLFSCRSCPQPFRETIRRFIKQQQKQVSSSQIEEERNMMLLNEFITNRCKKFGIGNRTPKNSGITLDVSAGTVRPLSPSMARRSSSLGADPYQAGPQYDERHQILAYHPPPYHQPMHFDAQTEQHHPPGYLSFVPGFVLPSDFPYMQERAGEWICKFCSHMHPNLKDPKFYWMAPDSSPPPPGFIDHHLSACRGFQESHFNELDYQGLPSNISEGNLPGALAPSYRWDPGFESEQTIMPANVDPREAFESALADVPSYEALTYGRRATPTSNEFPVDSPQRPSFTISAPLDAAESNEEYSRAIEYLSGINTGDDSTIEAASLVVGEDKLLLTDYFYFIMKQLSPVRFSEADRRTRGGKRENIAVGYGGLQCIHCANNANARKFFWSNVDRLANSFAEIPSHVLKCRRCPQPTKDALVLMKQRHPEQMSRLPRGSQKVFFRRMWRRLHDEDPTPTEGRLSPILSVNSPAGGGLLLDSGKPTRPDPVDTGSFLVEGSPAGTTGSEESIVIPHRSSEEAAKALADAAMQGGPPSPFSRVLLAVPEDNKWLSDTDCFIRRQLEVFCATTEDVENAHSDRKYPVGEGQVGIRCLHCALSKTGARGQGVSYPFNISGIYEAAREFQRLHLELCENLPAAARAKYDKLKGSSSLSSVLRKYYIIAANAIGLIDTVNGIRAGGKSIPILSQAAFVFSDESSPRNSGEYRGNDDKHSPDSTSTGSKPSQRPSLAISTDETHFSGEAVSGHKRQAADDDDSSRSPMTKRPAYSKPTGDN